MSYYKINNTKSFILLLITNERWNTFYEIIQFIVLEQFEYYQNDIICSKTFPAIAFRFVLKNKKWLNLHGTLGGKPFLCLYFIYNMIRGRGVK